MAIPLVVRDEEFKVLREYAEAHKIPVSEMNLIIKGEAPVVGDREGHVMIPGYDPDPQKNADFGWKVAYSIEEHPQPDGSAVWLRHMSMSSAIKERGPNLFALEMIATGLGFPPLAQCHLQQNPVDGFIEVLAYYTEETT